MPRPRERVYTLDKQKKHLARLSLLSAKRFRFNASHEAQVTAASARLSLVALHAFVRLVPFTLSPY